MLDKIKYLLQLEWMKMKPLASFKVSVLFYLILLPATFMFVKNMNSPVESLMQPYYKMPSSWHTMAYIASWFTFFFLPFLSIDSITTEFSNKTLRQNIITGMERNDYLLGKILMILAISLGATLYLGLVVLFFGAVFGNFNASGFSKSYYLLSFFLQNLGYMSMGTMLAVLLRRSGFALFLLFPYVLIIEPIIAGILKYNNDFMHHITNMFPGNVFGSLVPFNEITKSIGFSFGETDFWKVLIASVGYILIFIYISYWNFNKRDI